MHHGTLDHLWLRLFSLPAAHRAAPRAHRYARVRLNGRHHPGSAPLLLTMLVYVMTLVMGYYRQLGPHILALLHHLSRYPQ